MTKIYLYDSTLRDGSQTSTVNFSNLDKRKISTKLDELGLDYIEGGWPGANPTDDKFFADLPQLQNAKFSAFGMTKKPDSSAANDAGLNILGNCQANSVCIVGKAWDFHLTNALNISPKQNLEMIHDSISYLKSKNKEVLFDAEHFFDGYKNNPKFSLEVIKTAYQAGARWVVLCDTNGGSLPHEITKIINAVTQEIPGENLGIHCHNDTEHGVANSIAAVNAGVRQIQGTINGLGERCGNANLTSIIPILKYKLGFEISVSDAQIKKLAKISHFLDDLLNKSRNDFAPFIGKFAFAHKGGLHVSAVAKNPESYEHIDPQLVGNERLIMVSNQAGRSNIINKLKELNIEFPENTKTSQISNLVQKVKELEDKGYAFDSADASFELLVKRSLGIVPKFFELLGFKSLNERRYNAKGILTLVSEATVKVAIEDEIILNVAEGNGPVNAIDNALKKCLKVKYPQIDKLKLIDYKVRILTPKAGTEAITRVQIEMSDSKNNWSTIGVSQNIVDASFEALNDAIIYKLQQN